MILPLDKRHKGIEKLRSRGESMLTDKSQGLIAGCKENKTVDKACEHRSTKAVIHGDKEVEARHVSGKKVLHNLK